MHGLLTYTTAINTEMHLLLKEQVAQISQRNRAAGWVRYGQTWKTGTGRQYYTYIIGLSSTTVT